MSQCAYLIPHQSHAFSTMPFTHVDAGNTLTPIKRESALLDSRRSPPDLGHKELPHESSNSTSRLKPNPYSADQMSITPQSQRISPPSSTPPAGRNNESLPSIRDMIPELPALGVAPPTAATSNQDYGPESFRPSGPNIRATATGLAPSPMTSARMSSYPSPESTSGGISFSERQYSSSAHSGSRSSTSRNSPTQPPIGPLPYRSEPIRALPPLGTGFGSPEAGRANVYGSHSGSSLQHPLQPPPPPPTSAHWQGAAPSFHPSASGVPPAGYGAPPPPPPHSLHLQNPSPPYANYDNSDYGSDGKSKRRRGNLPKQVTDTLRKWFNEHIAHPYPTEDEKMMLMNATNLTMSQISNWFINARRRSMPQQHQHQHQHQQPMPPPLQQMPRDPASDVPMGYLPDRV